MKTGSDKSSTTTATTATPTASQPFFAKAGGGYFFAPVAEKAAPAVQMKMTVNQPGDKFEQEADKMANKVMRMPAPTAKEEPIQRQADDQLQKKEEDTIQKAALPEEKVQRAEMKEEKIQKAEGKEEPIQKAPAPEEKLQKKEADTLQRKGGDGTPAVGAGTQSAIQSKTTGGQPLSSDVRGYMEPRFGADFSNVRVHNDAEAASLSNQLSARAFTYQNHVFFSRGQYQPGTGEGRQLLAHELTHTIQQGHAVRRKANISSSTQQHNGIRTASVAVDKPAALSSEVVEVSSNTFNPSEKVREEIEAQGYKGLNVRILVKGVTEEGTIRIVYRGKNYHSTNKGSMLLLNAWTQQMGGVYINFDVKNSEIKNGYASMKPRGGNPNDWLLSLRKNADLLGGLGLSIENSPTVENKFDNGKVRLGVKDLKVLVGGFVDARFDVTLENIGKPIIEATADIHLKGAAKGQLKLANTQGKLAGELFLAIDFKAFSGSAKAKYNADGTIDIGGKAAYNANKLSGEIQFVSTDVETANNFAKDAIAAAGGKENLQNAGPPAPVPAPKAGKKQRGLAATGQLTFHLTTWFAGTVTVVVDGKGDVTVIGKIAPPTEIPLFNQKYWEKELVKFEAKAYYGIPVVGNLDLFANISLHALAKLGPAKIHKIEIVGTYSTDPAIQKSIQISAFINISAYAGLRLRAEGGAGVEIASHDLKFGIGLNADVGVQAYVDARPNIGYREPGEFYVSGILEMVAQPMLGLDGEFFIKLETPWWSPLSDDKWTWPLFSKEWPLSDPIGISASVKDYVLGSGKVPEVELKKPEFDPSKFMTSMVDQTLPGKSGGPGAGQGTFKEDGSVTKPIVPPKKPEPKKVAPKGGSKKTPPKGGKSASPNPKAAAAQNTTKLLKTAVERLTALKGKGPFGRAALDKELATISGVTFTVQPKGDKWLVTPKAGGKMSKKGVELGAKEQQDEKKVAQAKKLFGKDKKDERTPEEKQRDLDRAVQALRPKTDKLLQRGIPRPLLAARLLLWRRQYKLTALEISSGGLIARINPETVVSDVSLSLLGQMLEPVLATAERIFLARYENDRELDSYAETMGVSRLRGPNYIPRDPNVDDVAFLRSVRTGKQGVTKGYRINLPSSRKGFPVQFGLSDGPVPPRISEQVTLSGARVSAGIYSSYPAIRARYDREGNPTLDTLGEGERVIMNTERSRFPGMLATMDVARGIARVDPSQTRATVADHLAPMAIDGSGQAAEQDLGLVQYARKQQPLINKAREARRVRTANIFLQIRNTLNTQDPLLTKPGATKISTLDNAFQQWLQANLNPNLLQDPRKARVATMRFVRSLVKFLTEIRRQADS